MQKTFSELLILTNTQVNKSHKNINATLRIRKIYYQKLRKSDRFARVLSSKVSFLSTAVFDSLAKYVLVSLNSSDAVSAVYVQIQKKIRDQKLQNQVKCILLRLFWLLKERGY